MKVTEQKPAHAMDIKQSTNNGQADILNHLLQSAKMIPQNTHHTVDHVDGHDSAMHDSDGPPQQNDPLDNHIILVHGDLSTFERLETMKKHQQLEDSPVDWL